MFSKKTARGCVPQRVRTVVPVWGSDNVLSAATAVRTLMVVCGDGRMCSVRRLHEPRVILKRGGRRIG